MKEPQPQQNIPEKKEVIMQTTEVIRAYDPKVLAAILEIDKQSFEEQYDDAEEYYREALENQENINICLKEGNKIIGYLLALPHNKVDEELKKIDPEMQLDPERFYVETIEVLPAHRSSRGAFKMILSMIEEASKRGRNKFAMHTRVENGLSGSVQRYFGKIITKVRRIENWPYYYNGEPTDYLEATYE